VWDTKIVPTKGQRIELWGKLRHYEFTDKDANKRESVELVAEAIQIEGQKEAKLPNSGTMVNLHGVTVSDADIPF
jgi:single-stranded DNA-binding protein